MLKDLSKFIEENKGKSVWIATPAGMFRGDLTIIQDDTITLTNTTYYSAHIEIRLNNTTVVLSSIIAWSKSF